MAHHGALMLKSISMCDPDTLEAEHDGGGGGGIERAGAGAFCEATRQLATTLVLHAGRNPH